MIERLRNQERLSALEEARIEKQIRICILAILAGVVAFILWAALKHQMFGKPYYAVILGLLAVVWLVKYVVAAILEHSLAQRTDEQVAAYLKAAGLEFAAYAGLGWFLVAMSGNAIFGAVVYMIGVTGARRQKDIYYGDSVQDTAQSTREQTEPFAEAGMGEASPEEGTETAHLKGLPSAADRRDREEEHGSV